MKRNNTFEKLKLSKIAISILSKDKLNTILGGEGLTNTCNVNTKHMPSSPVICK